MIANIITVSRILFSLLLLVFPLSSYSFAALFLLCGITDVLDGFAARKLHLESGKGDMLDSAADLIFVGIYAVKILPLLSIPFCIWINYQTVCLHILSGILFKATGMKTVDFANEYLFVPLKIKEHKTVFAGNAGEHKAFIASKRPKENVWFADPQGLCTPGYGLCMSAYDMSKIGQPCLNHGMTDGTQIVSVDWIREITTPTYTADERFGNMKYGSLWWILDETKPVYAAVGDSGNVIYVDEKEKLTVTVASYFKPAVFDRIAFIENILKNQL